MLNVVVKIGQVAVGVIAGLAFDAAVNKVEKVVKNVAEAKKAGA